MMTPLIIGTSPMFVAANMPGRVPPRPAARQEADYLARYDSSTIFYDVFECADRVLAVGPPADSLTPEIQLLEIVDFSGRGRKLHIEPGLDRVGRFWTRRSRSGGPFSVRRPGGSSAPVSPDLSAVFRGRRAVVTVSKDNPLEWVSEWARWYVGRHGADALIVYDNGSSEYSLEQLASTLGEVSPTVATAVVDWRFPYGPVGAFPEFLHDSNYAQHGALEHARWRLLRESAVVLQLDIDELVIDPEGRSVFSEASRSPVGGLSLPGVWTYPRPGTPTDRRPKHSDSSWIKVSPPDADSPPKWCADMRRLPWDAQLRVHDIRGVLLPEAPSFYFWHHLAMSTNWNGGRPLIVADSRTHRVDFDADARVLAPREVRPRAALDAPAWIAIARVAPARWARRVRRWLSRRRKQLVSALRGIGFDGLHSRQGNIHE